MADTSFFGPNYLKTPQVPGAINSIKTCVRVCVFVCVCACVLHICVQAAFAMFTAVPHVCACGPTG